VDALVLVHLISNKQVSVVHTGQDKRRVSTETCFPMRARLPGSQAINLSLCGRLGAGFFVYIFSKNILYPNEFNTLVNVLRFILSAFLPRIFCITVGDTPAFCANSLTVICSASIFSSTNSCQDKL